MVLDGTEGQQMLDNLTINGRGQVLIQEDPGNQPYLAKVWLYSPKADRLTEFGPLRWEPLPAGGPRVPHPGRGVLGHHRRLAASSGTAGTCSTCRPITRYPESSWRAASTWPSTCRRASTHADASQLDRGRRGPVIRRALAVFATSRLSCCATYTTRSPRGNDREAATGLATAHVDSPPPRPSRHRRRTQRPAHRNRGCGRIVRRRRVHATPPSARQRRASRS